MKKLTILIVHGDVAFGRNVRASLSNQNLELIESYETNSIFKSIQTQRPDLIIIAPCRAQGCEGLDMAQKIRQLDRRSPIILIAPDSTEELAIAALRAGVNDYLREPFSMEELALSVRRCLSSLPDAQPGAEPLAAPSSFLGSERMVGESLLVREIKAYISNVAATDSNVLITGETGTGKELVAELVHRNSPRSQNAFVCVNCAAIPNELLESELFGYEKGAFTGARSSNAGKLKHAEGGTVFFDEIGDMSPYAQAKILRAIESKRVYRLGGSRSIALDIRVIAATNQDLEASVAEGRFRKDLYFRLNVARIHLPALRERKEDIQGLLEYYIRELNRLSGRKAQGFTEEVLENLLCYDWPGNIRELRNLLEAIFVTLPERMISFQDLPELYRRRFRDAKSEPHGELDRLLSALFSTNWNKSMAAQKLNWSRMTVYRKMAKYHLVTGAEKLLTKNVTSSHPM